MDSHEIKEAYRERMVKIYEKHNPSKVILGKPGTGWAISEFETRLSGPGTGVFFERFSPVQLRAEIDSLMAKYVGQEHTMYLKICKKYSVTPEPEIKATAGGMGLHGAVDAINSVDFLISAMFSLVVFKLQAQDSRNILTWWAPEGQAGGKSALNPAASGGRTILFSLWFWFVERCQARCLAAQVKLLQAPQASTDGDQAGHVRHVSIASTIQKQPETWGGERIFSRHEDFEMVELEPDVGHVLIWNNDLCILTYIATYCNIF